MPSRSVWSLSIELPDGNKLEASAPPSGTEPVRVHVLGRIEPHVFDACPICGSPATDKEHVPPEAMGGRVMTRTCEPCNNRLGARVEADLVDWHDYAVTLPSFSGNAVRGPRRSSRILVRVSQSGALLLLVDGNMDEGVRHLLQSGEVDLSAFLPDHNRVRLGLLKQAFLAASLYCGPIGAEGDIVRQDLIAARDAPRRENVPRSELGLGLLVARTDGGPRIDWPVMLAVADCEGDAVHGVLLAGTTFVSWESTIPAEGSRPLLEQRIIETSMSVSAPLTGTVTDVNGTR